MAFTVTFPTSGPCPPVEQVASWLKDYGEPFEREGLHTVVLRALPVRFVTDQNQTHLKAHLEVTSVAPLARVVSLLFHISVEAGADVRMAGSGGATRSGLWMMLADEQDRVRIAEALARAQEHGNREDLNTRLWAIIGVLRSKCDDRWDVKKQRIVELHEVGEGISLSQAAWHAESPQLGDVVSVPVDHSHHVHTLVWRWLSETYPGLAEHHNTLH